MDASTTAPARASVADSLRALRDQSVVAPQDHILPSALHVALLGTTIWSVQAGLEWVAIGLAPILAWLSHAALTRLHESVHGMFSRRRWVNDSAGVAIGTFAFTPFSVYRYVHARHHAYLGRPEDPEFRPYGLPEASRTKRVSYAWAELLLGFLVTPFLYSWRTARAWLKRELRDGKGA